MNSSFLKIFKVKIRQTLINRIFYAIKWFRNDNSLTQNEGVQIVFGYPGGAALNIYDEIYKQKFF